MRKYRVQIKTGSKVQQGTKARVYLTIFGNLGDSGEIQLSSGNNPLFDRGAIFIKEYELKELGNLTSVRIRHDNFGFQPGWFLEDIVIEDEIAHQEWTFPCYRWLAKDEDDHSIDRRLEPTTSDDVDWDVLVDHIDYDDSKIDPSRAKELTVSSRQIINKTDAEITQEFRATKAIESTFEFSLTESIDIERSVQVNITIPGLGSASSDLKVTLGLQAGQRWQRTESETYEIVDTINVPKRTSIVATGYIDWIDDLDVPYELFLRVKANFKHNKEALDCSELEEALKIAKFQGTIIEEHEDANELLVRLRGKLTGSWGVDTRLEISEPTALI